MGQSLAYLRIFATRVWEHALFCPCLFWLSYSLNPLACLFILEKLLTGSFIYLGKIGYGGLPLEWLDIGLLFSWGSKKVYRSCLWDHSVSPKNNPVVSCLVLSVLKVRWERSVRVFQVGTLSSFSALGFTFALYWVRCPWNSASLILFFQRIKLGSGLGERTVV